MNKVEKYLNLSVEFQSPTGELIKVFFVDNLKCEEDMIKWYYEENWCFTNLFYYVDVKNVFINDQEKTMSDLKKLLSLPEEDETNSDTWGFNPNAKFSLLKDV